MYPYQRKILDEVRKISEASVMTINRVNKDTEDQNKRTSETLRKYRVPPNFTGNFAALRKRRDMLPPGARIMWGKDDSDLDVIPAHEVQKYLETGWVIIEGHMTMGDDEFVIVNESFQKEDASLTEAVMIDPDFKLKLDQTMTDNLTLGPGFVKKYNAQMDRLKSGDRGGFLVLTRYNNSFELNYMKSSDINFAMTQTGFQKIAVGEVSHKSFTNASIEHKIIAMKT